MPKIKGYPAPAKNNNPYILDVPELVGCNDCPDSYKATSVFDNVLTPINTDVDDIDNPFINPKQARAGIFAPASALHSNTIVDNKDIDNLFSNSGQARLGIFLTTFAFRSKTYKEHIGRKTEAYVP